MMLGDEKIKFKDYHTFTEVDISSENTRLLEWRRSLNNINIEVNSFVVEQTHWVNSCDTLSGIIRRSEFDTSEYSNVVETIKSEIKEKISVNCVVDIDSIRDKFYRTVVIDRDEKIYSIVKSNGNIILNISEGIPKNEKWGLFSAGAYYGTSFIDEDSGNLYINVSVDKLTMHNLINEIRHERVDVLSVEVVIDSFSSELDDALRDFHNSRDLLIHDFSTPSAIQSLVIKGKSISRSSATFATPKNESSEDFIDDSRNKILDLRPFNTYLNYFKHIKNALWLISFFLFLLVIK
jgi:hypothetical protein